MQIAIDKCNRVCKGKSRNNKRGERRAETSIIDIDTVKDAIRRPVIAHVMYGMMLCPGTPIAVFQRVRLVQSWVKLHDLPCNIREEQFRMVRNTLHTNTLNTLNTLNMYVCMACVSENRVVLDSKMRVMADGSMACTNCKQLDTVLRINTLGRIVEVKKTNFYYCLFCMRVHVWAATGCEFHTCSLSTKALVAPPVVRNCHYCARTNSIETVSILDDEMGVMQEISLCARHMPHEQRLKYVDNLHQLRQAVKDKLNRVQV